MKKKVFRERYNMVNGNGEILKEGVTIEDINKMEITEDETANKVEIKAVKKRGRKKSVKSNK